MVGKFQSFHSRAVCVIVSEAQAIADVIYEEIESLMTAEIVLVVILGNPLRTTGRYAKMLRDTTHNIVINLSCLESPNVIEGREVIPGVCSAKWVERMRERYRPDEPMWIAKVLGYTIFAKQTTRSGGTGDLVRLVLTLPGLATTAWWLT